MKNHHGQINNAKVVIFKSHCCHFIGKDIFKGNAKSCSLNSNNCCPFEKTRQEIQICIRRKML